jgi:hypothetical protein
MDWGYYRMKCCGERKKHLVMGLVLRKRAGLKLFKSSARYKLVMSSWRRLGKGGEWIRRRLRKRISLERSLLRGLERRGLGLYLSIGYQSGMIKGRRLKSTWTLVPEFLKCISERKRKGWN